MESNLDKVLQGIEHTETSYITAPKATYVVVNTSNDTSGSDYGVYIDHLSHELEMYSRDKIDHKTEALIESRLVDLGIQYSKQERTFLPTERMFMTVFSFEEYLKKEA